MTQAHAHFTDSITWSAPWLAPYRALAAHNPEEATCTALNRHAGATVTFVAQSAMAEGQAYEQFIFDTQTVPTRDNLHDFFNGLCWHLLPHTKRRLNQLQAQTIAADGIQATRGPLRDALTVFDENGALLHAPTPLWTALRAHDWQALFVTHRALWQQAQLLIVGHALLEKLVSPRKPLVAHVLPADAAINCIATTDAWLAQQLTPEWLSTKPFSPLPVLGVPGWWAENEEPGFYDDVQVFRPRRSGVARDAWPCTQSTASRAQEWANEVGPE